MELLNKILGIGSYEMENSRLEEDNKYLTEELAVQKEMNISLASRIVNLEHEVKELREEPDRIIEQEVIKHTIALEEQYKDDLWHRSYNAGRQDAYREMGVKSAIDRWQKKKEALGIGVVDITDDLVDVLGDDEITIDDLIELEV